MMKFNSQVSDYPNWDSIVVAVSTFFCPLLPFPIPFYLGCINLNASLDDFFVININTIPHIDSSPLRCWFLFQISYFCGSSFIRWWMVWIYMCHDSLDLCKQLLSNAPPTSTRLHPLIDSRPIARPPLRCLGLLLPTLVVILLVQPFRLCSLEKTERMGRVPTAHQGTPPPGPPIQQRVHPSTGLTSLPHYITTKSKLDIPHSQSEHHLILIRLS